MAASKKSGVSIDQLVEDLCGPSRRKRQDAAHELALIAAEDAEQVRGCVDELIDALYRPEAQTRWESLSALSELALLDAERVREAYDGAEASLFDEGSAMVRLAAFKFLCRFGSTSPERADVCWPVIDEAIQCYHGDAEYHDMLLALLDFVRGDISDDARASLVARVSFDARNGSGYVKAFSAQIVDASGLELAEVTSSGSSDEPPMDDEDDEEADE